MNWFQEDGQTILHIERGSYLRTVARWKEDGIEIETFRPATEDVIVYDPELSTLTIKAGLVKDRDHYFLAFAVHLAENLELATKAVESQVFSLAPIQQRKFDYTGNEEITRIALVKASLRINDMDSPQPEIKSKNVLETLSRSLRGISLDQGQLTSVRLRFQVRPDNGQPATVSFDIEPPSRTNLAQKRYAKIIESYLREQGVKLR